MLRVSVSVSGGTKLGELGLRTWGWAWGRAKQ